MAPSPWRMLFTVLILPSVSQAAPTWTEIASAQTWKPLATRKHADAGEVQVYHQAISGTPCFRAVAKTTAKPQACMETVTDIPSATRWSTAGLTQSTLLGQSGNSLDYLQYLDVPAWTFSSDRFWILRGTKTITGSHYVFSWTRLGDKGGPYRSAYDAVLAANSSAVEPPLNVGAWEFTQSGSTTTVTYTICTDSGGSVPRSIQNAATKKTLPDTVGDLVRECLIRSK